MINKEKYLNNTSQELNKTFLYLARKGDLETIDFLLTDPRMKGKIDINYKDEHILGMTALINAVYDNKKEVVEYGSRCHN